MTVPPIYVPDSKEAVTGVWNTVTALDAVLSSVAWVKDGRCSVRSVNRMLMAPPIRVMPPEVMATRYRNGLRDRCGGSERAR